MTRKLFIFLRLAAFAPLFLIALIASAAAMEGLVSPLELRSTGGAL